MCALLHLAQEEAQRLHHNYLGTEHLLLGLVREGEGVAGKVLSSLGVDLEKVRKAVEDIIGRGGSIVFGEIGLTPRAKKVIAYAVDEAKRLNHHYIGTEHLLLGLVRNGEGVATGVLDIMGVSLEQVRTQVMPDGRFVRTFTDISQRKGTEVALAAAQTRAAHAERLQALGQLAGGIAHDFNNVLQAVQGSASLLGKRAADSEGVRRLAGTIQDAAERGASITRRLLSFARRGDLRAEPVDVATAFGTADAVLVITDHPDYRRLDVRELLTGSPVRLVFDSWRILEADAVRDRGVRYAALGYEPTAGQPA